MRATRILCLLTIAAASLAAAPSVAQMYPGADITVNPEAIPRTNLLEPGQPYPGIITLHPPRPHHVVHHTTTVAKTDATATAAADPTMASVSIQQTDSPPPPPKPKQTRHVAAAAAAAPPALPDSSSSVPFSFGEDEPPQAAQAPAKKVASAEPPPAQTPKPQKADAMAGLAKRGAILFEHSSTDPQPSQLDGIKLLAGDLNAALEAGATQIQLQAFGGPRGDKSSDARRVSLKRALAIRQLLIDNGVPSNRIITKAMGGATDNGEPDRVDIYVRT
jgi:outer membrane protein OmpA-like peptidoglycan-associated protein